MELPREKGSSAIYTFARNVNNQITEITCSILNEDYKKVLTRNTAVYITTMGAWEKV